MTKAPGKRSLTTTPRKRSLVTTPRKPNSYVRKGRPIGPWRFDDGLTLSEHVAKMKIGDVLKILSYKYRYRSVFAVAKHHEFKIATRLVGDGKYVNIYRIA